jgi:hypothetical protein
MATLNHPAQPVAFHQAGPTSFSVGGNVGLFSGSDYIPCCQVTGSAATLANHFVSFGAGDTSNAGGYLAQNFSTVTSQAYGFEVDLGAVGGHSSTSLSQSFIVQIIDVPSQAILFSTAPSGFSVPGTNCPCFNNGYASGFTAVSSSTEMKIFDISQTFSIDGIVDNAQVYVEPALAVPEPSTWVMMILGFAGLGFMTYRRKRFTVIDGGRK